MPSHRILLALPALALAASGLTGCGSDDAGAGDGLSVVTSIYPLQFLAERIGGEHVTVENLTQPGQEPHDLELTVSETATVIEADVLVYLSDFQAAVDGAVEQTEAEHVVDAAGPADLMPAADDAHEHDDDEGDEAHAGEELDPHFWLDPTRMAAVAGAVADALGEADPEHADDYADNLADLEAELTALDEDIAAGLSECERDTVVVSHNAFQYWALRYDLHMRAIAGLSPDAEPSPQHIAELQDLIEQEGITTVFSETLASPEMAETLAGDLGLGTAVLDPVEGLSDETADEDYLSLMRNNLAALQQANGCR